MTTTTATYLNLLPNPQIVTIASLLNRLDVRIDRTDDLRAVQQACGSEGEGHFEEGEVRALRADARGRRRGPASVLLGNR